jgi:hypothetical protein
MCDFKNKNYSRSLSNNRKWSIKISWIENFLLITDYAEKLATKKHRGQSVSPQDSLRRTPKEEPEDKGQTTDARYL